MTDYIVIWRIGTGNNVSPNEDAVHLDAFRDAYEISAIQGKEIQTLCFLSIRAMEADVITDMSQTVRLRARLSSQCLRNR